MATYYVRKTGNDSNAGTSAGAAWLTVDKAANTVAAGDTVYIGAGTYRELVTMDTSGSSGSVISYTGDITGTYTGDAGLVIITAHDSDDAVSTRASVVDFNGKSFFEWHNCMFIGGTAFVVGNTAYASATAYEGVVISNCVVIATSNTFGVKAELNAGATPTTSGLKILQSTVHGGIDFDWDSNGTADINLKILIDSCRVIAIGGNDGIQCSRVTNGGAFYIGGVTISNCYVSGNTTEAIYFSYLLSTTYPCIVANNIIAYPTTYGVSNLSGTAGAVLLYGNVVLGATNISNVCTEVIGNSLRAVALLGGLHDQHLYQAFGYSPYLPFEPMTAGGYTSPVIDLGHNDYAQTLDHYGNPRNMGRATPAGKLYYMDGSDAAATDPNAVWTNEANVVDSSEVTYASVATTGSTASNYVMAEGTSAPASGGTIAKVQARLIHGATSGSPSGEVVVYSDGLAETLATVSVSSTTTVTASPWADLTPPTGGWTWAGIQALEFKAYRTAAGTWRLYQVQIGVITDSSTVDIGAVEARNQPTQDTTIYNDGASSAKFSGAGIMEFPVAVEATSTTVSVAARYDSNYTGSLPKLEVFGITGVADQSVSHTGSASAWQVISVTFTPTAACVARVRLSSLDTSTNGKCYFDSLLVE